MLEAGKTMRKSVYVETTVPSAYVSRRQDARSLYRRQITRQWWSEQRRNFDVLTSQEVFRELNAFDFPGRSEAVEMLRSVSLLEITEDVVAISEVYVHEKLMPGPVGRGDGLHLAVAAFHGIDFLVTWNIRHMANLNKAEHMVVLNRRLALLTPVILTPEMLWLET